MEDDRIGRIERKVDELSSKIDIILAYVSNESDPAKIEADRLTELSINLAANILVDSLGQDAIGKIRDSFKQKYNG